MILFILFTILAILYIILISFYTYAWFSLKSVTLNPSEFSVKATIIIAVRNEENNILECLGSIISQNYPTDFYEIIVSDDNSTDNTINKIQKFIAENPSYQIKLIKSSEQFSKKQALSNAIKISQNDLIITTDADCVMSEKWLFSIIDYYKSQNPKMIVSPVVMENNNSVFGKLQSLEFVSLISSSAAAINLNNPIMCNGANLAFSKKAFWEVNGYDSDKKYSSGDDIFLLLKFKKRFGSKSIAFLKNFDAIVYSKAAASFKEFYNQRIRWVSKSKGYQDFNIIAIAIIILLFNVSIPSAFILAIFNKDYLLFAISLLGIKLFFDFPLLAGFTNFIKRNGLLWYYLILQPIYVVYISVFGILGNFLSFNWKGRKS
ncbi:MAG: glycosyltransferase [Saprospiraceae bacterium]|nr:glycosyltransferase [Saprospiraceae bacterium]